MRKWLGFLTGTRRTDSWLAIRIPRNKAEVRVYTDTRSRSLASTRHHCGESLGPFPRKTQSLAWKHGRVCGLTMQTRAPDRRRNSVQALMMMLLFVFRKGLVRQRGRMSRLTRWCGVHCGDMSRAELVFGRSSSLLALPFSSLAKSEPTRTTSSKVRSEVVKRFRCRHFKPRRPVGVEDSLQIFARKRPKRVPTERSSIKVSKSSTHTGGVIWPLSNVQIYCLHEGKKVLGKAFGAISQICPEAATIGSMI